MSHSIKAIVREAKNKVLAYSEIEIKVREATSNDPWHVKTSEMAEIAKATHDYEAFPKLFAMLWKRLVDKPQVNHVKKALILTEFLLRNGSDRFINEARNRAADIENLKDYKLLDQDGTDLATDAATKAKQVYELLTNETLLAEERKKAAKLRGVASQSYSSEQSNYERGMASSRYNDAARVSTSTETNGNSTSEGGDHHGDEAHKKKKKKKERQDGTVSEREDDSRRDASVSGSGADSQVEKKKKKKRDKPRRASGDHTHSSQPTQSKPVTTTIDPSILYDTPTRPPSHTVDLLTGAGGGGGGNSGWADAFESSDPAPAQSTGGDDFFSRQQQPQVEEKKAAPAAGGDILSLVNLDNITDTKTKKPATTGPATGMSMGAMRQTNQMGSSINQSMGAMSLGGGGGGYNPHQQSFQQQSFQQQPFGFPQQQQQQPFGFPQQQQQQPFGFPQQQQQPFGFQQQQQQQQQFGGFPSAPRPAGPVDFTVRSAPAGARSVDNLFPSSQPQPAGAGRGAGRGGPSSGASFNDLVNF